MRTVGSRSAIFASPLTFRVLLALALLIINYLAFSPTETPIVTNLNDKASHILAFLCLAFLVDFSWPISRWNLPKIASLISYGLFIEVVQFFLPNRLFSLWDLAADAIGLLCYPLILPLLLKIHIFESRYNSSAKASSPDRAGRLP
ncbi:MAG: VanZ family protein [Candidatus Thiodiazotropha sp.]|nr:VanZ family protein [Candidatus Thiodiazotropha sp.]MCM8882635.1 VanZ family protein [Candidatus Thiodiazotropha sp.]MCM8919203.1 VanZ family protein [Candidatus Thiodiazotropha sp.]MCU7872185.1 VanZ family protein [Candidatus Thiodiazotropha sp. (ex Lucinoma borealis)]